MQIDRLFREVDTDGSGKVDILDWLDYVEPQRVKYLHTVAVVLTIALWFLRLCSQLCTVPVSNPAWSLLLTPHSQNVMSAAGS